MLPSIISIVEDFDDKVFGCIDEVITDWMNQIQVTFENRL